MNFDYEIDSTLARYFGGNATSEDMLFIENWVSLSSNNQTYFDEMTQIYAISSGINLEAFIPNIAKAKANFSNYIKSEKEGNMKTIPFYKNWMFQVAASIAIIVAVSSFLLIFNSNDEIILSSGSNGELVKTLPDNTIIPLSKNTEIEYSSHFGESEKDIHLINGTISLHVGNHNNIKLRVIAGETMIEDIGTVFKISSEKDRPQIEVSVSEGEVHFFTNSDRGIDLRANDMGSFNKVTKQFSLLNVNKALKEKTTSSKTPVIGDTFHIKFEDVALGEAVKSLDNQFKVKIKFRDKDIANKRITVNFEGENVDMALQIIAQTLDLRVTGKDGNYLFEKIR
jgi:transmembrane sensor